MFSKEIQSPTLSECIKTMWRNWVMPVGLVVILFFISLIVPKYYMVTLVGLCSVILFILDRRFSRNLDLSMLISTPRQIEIILAVSAVILFAIVKLTEDYTGHEFTGQKFNPDIPVLAPIIILIVTVIVTGINLTLKLNAHRLQRYMQTSALRTTLTLHRARMLNREAVYHARMLFWISLCLLIIGAIYRLSFYNNDSISARDLAVYALVPALTFLLSLIFLAIRYYALFTYYCRNDFLRVVDQGGATRMRYIIISGDRIYLRRLDAEGVIRYDTPISYTLPYRRKIMRFDAITLLQDTAGLDTRYIEVIEAYQQNGAEMMHNEFHFFCFANMPNDVESAFSGGEWYTLGNLKRLYDHGVLTPEFIAELHRVTTIAMACKAYDRNGRRLYKIRNYRPTFRIADIHTWDIDYNDAHWLTVAKLNQDKPFFCLRRRFSAAYNRDRHNHTSHNDTDNA